MKKHLNLFFTMLKIGLFTFGGGYAMIALLENEFISKKKWMKKMNSLIWLRSPNLRPDLWPLTPPHISGISFSAFGEHFSPR